MKILHLIASLQQGGAETLLLALAKELKPQAEQHVVYFHDGPLRAQFEELGIPLTQIQGIMPYDPLFQLKLYRCLQKNKPDIIHASLWSANFFGRTHARLLKIPIICAVHAVASHEGGLRNMLDRLLMVKPTQIIAVAPAIKDELIEKIHFSPTSISVIANGIDTHFFSEQKKRCASGKDTSLFTIGFVGRLAPVKMIPLLVRSFAQALTQVPTLRLVIVGDGPERQTIVHAIKQKGISAAVKLVGRAPSAAWLGTFDCFVLPSHYEGLSLALLEAMASELPVIVTGANQAHDVITHEYHGLIVPPLDEQALTNALLFVARNRNKARAFGENGAKAVHHAYSIATTAKQYMRLFHTAMAAKT